MGTDAGLHPGAESVSTVPAADIARIAREFAAAAPREWLESVRAVAATLGQIARASPEAHSAAAAAADPVGALDPARLVRALAAVGEFDEAAAVAKLFGVSAKDGAR